MMETKAGYVAVGLAAVLAIALFCGFLLFALDKGGISGLAHYYIEFEGGVSGLSVGSEVRFNGIRVGEVRRIEISAPNPSLVRVIIAIGDDVPVYADSEASVEAVGITGLSVVYITGGNPESSRLFPAAGEEMAMIKARPSSLRSLFQKTPEILDSANTLLRRGGELLSKENEENLRRIIASLAELSSRLEKTGQGLDSDLTLFHSVLGKLDRLLSEDLPSALGVFRLSFQRFHEVLNQADPGLVAADLRRLLDEGRFLLHNLNMLTQRINADPRGFLFGDAVPGYKIK